jgi:hypothetical protein
MAGQCGQGPKDFAGKLGPVFGKGAHESAPSIAILTERGFNGPEIALERNCGAVVKGVR